MYPQKSYGSKQEVITTSKRTMEESQKQLKKVQDDFSLNIVSTFAYLHFNGLQADFVVRMMRDTFDYVTNELKKETAK